MFKTILIAYDGSDHARNALGTACKLAKTFDARLHLVHSPQIDTPTVVVGSFVSQLEAPPTKEQVEEAGQKLVEQAKAVADMENIDIANVHIATDTPSRAILQTAEKVGADLIVMGRRGLGSVGALALGSVSQSVSHGAKCACLTTY